MLKNCDFVHGLPALKKIACQALQKDKRNEINYPKQTLKRIATLREGGELYIVAKGGFEAMEMTSKHMSWLGVVHQHCLNVVHKRKRRAEGGGPTNHCEVFANKIE